MSPDISVIIPLYNAEKYIRSCVQSVLNQTFRNFELIIVDDCSKDNGAKICTKNSGAGISRNNGIKIAAGKYIAFIDSDDQMLPDNLEGMFTVAEKYNADVVHASGFLICNGDDKVADMLSLPKESFTPVSFDNTPVKKISVENTQDKDLLLQRWIEHYYHGVVWNKLFRREMLSKNNIEFLDVHRSEDEVFAFVCLFHSERYVMLPFHSYVYSRLKGSLSHSKSPADISNVWTNADASSNFWESMRDE